MNLIEKFRSNPKNIYYAIAAGAFILINIVGFVLYSAKNNGDNMVKVEAETITEIEPSIVPTEGPTPTYFPTPTPEPSPSVTPTPKPTNIPTPTATPTSIAPTPTVVSPTPISPTPTIVTPTPITPTPTSVGTT